MVSIILCKENLYIYGLQISSMGKTGASIYIYIYIIYNARALSR